ncbi:MAG TPA: hypothetical protein PK867_31330 [Pirellulales bacterium]|nr:hypothetical protein [Pirellulales bacterium]
MPTATRKKPPRRPSPAMPPLDSPAAAPVRASASRHDLRAMLGDGAAFSVMVGIGETYLPAFALAAGLGEVAAGRGLPFRVLTSDSPVVGVTHASDLPAVSAELARQVALGERSAALWAG